MKELIIVRGGGDIATGTIYKLKKCGFSVLVLEATYPSAIRRNVAFSEAVYEGHSKVEDMECFLAKNEEEAEKFLQQGKLTMLVDPDCACLERFHPAALVDAILAKRNLGTSRNMAPLTIGLGPGFFAEEDVDYVVETMRGHDLARIITEGPAIPNTGVPGMVGGVSKERVIHSPGVGRIHNMAHIADIVEKGQILAYVGETPVEASITGVLRGIIKEGYNVPVGMKIADIDPRKEEKKNCFTNFG